MDYYYSWAYFVFPVLFFVLVFGLFAWTPSRWRYSRWNDYERRRDYDYPLFGGFYYPNAMAGPLPRPRKGRGPKNYRRSDERILDEIGERLSLSEVDAGDVELACRDGHVTLTGSVLSRQDKRIVEWIVDTVGGVADVKNDLRISAAGPRKAA
jgi:hypothetical protein